MRAGGRQANNLSEQDLECFSWLQPRFSLEYTPAYHTETVIAVIMLC